jgi:hypothetical protein
MDINIEMPLNTVSFGHCSFNILVEFFKRGLTPNIFPISNQVEINAYKVDGGFKDWLTHCINKSTEKYDKSAPGLKLWHFSGSQANVSNNNHLLTFHETSRHTPYELNVARNQKKVFVTNDYSKTNLEKEGLTNIGRVDLGFDNLHFIKTNKRYLEDMIVFSVNGKLEPVRKQHKKVIQTWIRRYGGSRKHVLHLSVGNPFLNEQQFNAVLGDIFQGQRPPPNVNLLPWTTTLMGLNDSFNACNIVIDMGTESWSLPSFHCVGLGKYGIIGNWAGLKSWATEKNSVLVNPAPQMIPSVDGMFFAEGQPWNQGDFFTFDENEFVAACEKAESLYLANKVNKEGELLREIFTWKKTVDTLLETINAV